MDKADHTDNTSKGFAKDPGCVMEYTQVDDSFYWSGDGRERMNFNDLVPIKNLPDPDTKKQ